MLCDGQFAGIDHRRRGDVTRLDRTSGHGATRADEAVYRLDAPELVTGLGDSALAHLNGEIRLLDEAGHQFSEAALLAGTLTPVYFGSALTNFGVEAFLRDFLAMAPPPTARESSAGPISPTSPAFPGFVFKIQANMDPRHRDRIAFVRVCSGRYEAGLDVRHVRTGKTLRLSAPQQLMARERTSTEEAWPGDESGNVDRGTLRTGPTRSAAGRPHFDEISRFPHDPFQRRDTAAHHSRANRDHEHQVL